MYVDHIRVQSIKNWVAAVPLSTRATSMLERVAEQTMPPVLCVAKVDPDGCFAVAPIDELQSEFIELESMGLIDYEIEADDDTDSEVEDLRFWASLSLAYALPRNICDLIQAGSRQ